MRAVIACFLRRIVEDIDAISTLMKKSLSDPCFLNVRRLFENYIYLKFILKEKEKIEERAKAYYVNHLLNKRNNAEEEDNSTLRGKALRAKIEKDDIAKYLSVSSQDCKNTVDAIDSILQQPQYQQIKNEFDRIKKEKRKKGKKGIKRKLGNHWYSLFDGPTNLEELSAKVGCSGLYYLYGYYSKYSHSENELDNLDSQGAGQAGLVQTRNAEKAQQIAQMTLNYGLFSFQIALQTLMPRCLKCYKLFYQKNIQFLSSELRNKNIINVIR